MPENIAGVPTLKKPQKAQAEERTLTCLLRSEEETVIFGEKVAKVVKQAALLTIEGELGTGKTTLCRGILRGLGVQGAVKSPTFTLVEPYLLGDRQIYHFDFYRLEDPQELEYIGIEDYFSQDCLCLVEWPNKGQGYLPSADVCVQLRVADSGRMLTWQARSSTGREMTKHLREILKSDRA